MPPEEGRALLDELTAFATQPRYIFSVSWQPGDLVAWSNLATLHRGGGFDELRYKRNMRRTTIRAGAAPEGDDQPHLEMYRQSLEIMGRSAAVVS
jgi:alpha-ketoglutarate-dependent 2,4-dichlorophenoxyacetate dioxygenase